MFVFICACIASANALGINLGNVLEAPTEGAWAPAAQEYYFADYKQRGFTTVRVPVRWDNHTAQDAPYTIDPSFMARVQQVVGWSLAQNLTTIINAHHDECVKKAHPAATFAQATNNPSPPHTLSLPSLQLDQRREKLWCVWRTTPDCSESSRPLATSQLRPPAPQHPTAAKLPRYLAIWQQVAAAFAAAPTRLRFETLNEPTNLTIDQLNDMHAKVLPVMRAGGGNNAAREVYLVGLSWDGADWLLAHPDAVVFPPLPSGAADPHLRFEVHSYDPYQFCLQDPPSASSWGTPADVAAVENRYKGLGAWAASKGRALLMGECGCFVKALSRADRLKWYATVGQAVKLLPDEATIWDDDGDWKIYNRAERTWDEGVMSALGL